MTSKKTAPNSTSSSPPKCGVVMPISSLDGCSEQHWIDVQAIIFDAIKDAGCDPNLVSDADDVGIIQKRIIQNLFDNPIVVCDVSGKNPNVMFELGLRLAFDKPTIIVKDDKTSYSFDTSPIEHLTYPRDLRFNKIVGFKKDLASKVAATLKKSIEDPNYTTFLKNFGSFTVATLETKEVSQEVYILDELADLRHMIARLVSRSAHDNRRRDVLNVRRSRGFHRLSADECQDVLVHAVGVVAKRLGEHESAMEVLSQTSRVLTECQRFGALPVCFDEDRASCMAILQEAIERFLSRKPTAESVE